MSQSEDENCHDNHNENRTGIELSNVNASTQLLLMHENAYEEDVEYWELWDENEEYLHRNTVSREKEADKIRALKRSEFHRSRSRCTIVDQPL